MQVEKEGFNFIFDTRACDTCRGNCCIGDSGYIWVSGQEIEDISSFLNLTSDEFCSKYLFKVGYSHFSIREVEFENGYACAFFDTKKHACSIYDVRPSQCRTFPFWNHFKKNIEDLECECPGVKRV